MKQALIFLLIVISLHPINAQVGMNTDSLKRELEHNITDTSKVNLLNQLAFGLLTKNLPEAGQYSQKAFDLANEIDYKKGLARAHNNLAIVAAYRGERENAFHHYHESLKIDSLIDNKSGMANTYNNLGITYDYLGDKPKAVSLLKRSIELYEMAGNEEDLTKPYTNLANTYEDYGWYTLALDYNLKSLNLDREYGNPDGIAVSLINIGNVYAYRELYDKALENYHEALKISDRTDNREYKSMAHSGIARASLHKEQYKEALYHQQQCMELGKATGKKYQTDDDYRLLGEIYYEMGELNKASRNFNQALAISKDMQNRAGQASSLIFLAQIDMKNQALEAAIKKVTKAEQLASSSNEKGLLRDAYKELAAIYHKQQNHSKAYDYHVKYHNLDRKIMEDASSQQLAELQTIHETSKKDKEIALQESRLVNQEVLLEQRSLQRNLLFVILAGLLAISGLLGFIYHNRLRTKNLLIKKDKELEATRSRFFANISHEFRTPLTLIIGQIQELLRENKNGDEQKILSSVKHNSSVVLNLVNQMLDLSRIDIGKMDLHIQHVNIIEVLKLHVEAFQSLARQKGVKLTAIYPKAETKVFIDPDILEKVINNLLSNAIKYTESGGSVKFSAAIQSDNLAISIKDTGIGISSDDISRIFDRFYRVSDASEGTGIGLALTKELVKLHKGDIHVKSEYGKGSVFSFEIPIKKQQYSSIINYPIEEFSLNDVPTKVETEGHVEIDDSETTIQKVDVPILLVVEDNAELRNYIKRNFHDDYEIILAEHAEEALEKAHQRIPDIILCDWMMPGMSGIELCEKLRSNEMTSHIPIILLTAKAGIDSKIEGLETGVDDYLTKPFEMRELKVRLNNLITQRDLLREKFSKLELHQYKQVKVSSADERFLKQFYDLLDANLASPELSVEFLSREIGVSRVQLHRKLTALMGFSCSDLIRDYRLERAADLIKQKSGNISEIAFQVGFENLSYFTRSFKQKFNATPSAYA